MMMSGMCASVQTELDTLFGQLKGMAVRSREVSAQAFSKARKGFSAELFRLAGRHLLALAQPQIDAARWNGLRVVAADASRLRVSTRANAKLSADHYAFALFLPGAELTLHASLHPADGSERQMLFEALDELDAGRDLLVLDRGYVGNTMVAALASGPPRQNTCHLDRILNSGAMMRERVGAIRTRIQRQSGGAVAAAGECNGGVGCA